jgi:hypothetical protein
VVEFSESLNGTYSVGTTAAVNSRFAKITASVTAPIFLLPVISGISPTLPISAGATAGQGVASDPGRALAPFTPDAVDPGDTANFGFTTNEFYDIKWAPPGARFLPGGRCSGDVAVNKDAAGGAADRGYINLGQGNGNTDLYNGIVNNDYSKNGAVILRMGDTIDVVPGNKNVGPALSQRIAQDSDPTTPDPSLYSGNGRRLLILPVNDSTPAGRIMGYGSFFLPANTCLNNNEACCAQYLGPAVVGADNKAAGPAGNLYTVKLFR